MAEPTDEQLREYALKLPQIYRDVLEAFPKVDPGRRRGDAALIDRNAFYKFQLKSVESPLREWDIRHAINALCDAGILDTNEFSSLFPTEVGERLITLLTGHEAKVYTIPELPAPTW